MRPLITTPATCEEVVDRAIQQIWNGAVPILMVGDIQSLEDICHYIHKLSSMCLHLPEFSVETTFSLEDDQKVNLLLKSAVEAMLQCNATVVQTNKECHDCNLHKTRQTTVWGEGLCHNGIMVVGEAPGRDEDLCGRPFMGTAGQTLRTLLIEEGVNPHHCRITNTVKCNPTTKAKPGCQPVNRPPTSDEKQACWKYLEGEIALYRPKVILAVGLTAAQNILSTKHQMARLIAEAGNFCDDGLVARIGNRPVRVFPCYHTSPLCVNRMPGAKDQIRESIRKAAEYVGYRRETIPF